MRSPHRQRRFSGPAADRRQVLLGLAGALTIPFQGCGGGPETVGVAGTETGAAAGGPLPNPLWRGGAGELAAAIARGDVSSLEVIEAHLERIAEVNGQINAIVAVYADEARRDAEEADAAVAAGARLGPLHGVPFTIKDNLDQLGKPNTNGLEENLENLATVDALVVERYRGAGGVPIGRTNLPDMGLRVHTYSETWGRTLNPWSAEHNVAGSSGGEAAALAVGMTPIGLGNDIGGSLRNPANCTGTASLKPSLGRIAQRTAGGIGGQLMAVDGPMARNVADVRLGYEILAGGHPADPWSAPVPLDLDPPSERRAALLPEPPGGETHPTVADGVRRAGEALAKAGWEVEEIEPPRLVEVFQTWWDVLVAELQPGMPFFRTVMNDEAVRFLELALAGSEPRDGLLADALERRHELAVEWSTFLQRHPIVVGPVFTQPPFEVGYDIRGEDEAKDVILQLRMISVANILGLPAAAVPVGVADDGLPRGVQIVADRFRDDLALEGAAAVEADLGTFTPIDPG